MKLATNIHHMSGNCWKGFQGQRSKVKVYNGRDIHFNGVASRSLVKSKSKD